MNGGTQCVDTKYRDFLLGFTIFRDMKDSWHNFCVLSYVGIYFGRLRMDSRRCLKRLQGSQKELGTPLSISSMVIVIVKI